MESPNSAEIIRPILRGRDIKKYGRDFADLWLINTHNGARENNIKPIRIDNYPAIKKHLDQFYLELEKRADQGSTPYNLRNCAYLEDFSKNKIIYPDIMRMPRQEKLLQEYPYFFFDEESFYAEATNFIMTGADLEWIYLFLASDLGFFVFSKFYSGPQFDATGFRYKKAYLEETFVPRPTDDDRKTVRYFMDRIKKNEDISDQINAFWYKIAGLSSEESSLVDNYKRGLIV
jgi:adenine-specific DNA-methyltransferase